MYARGEKKKRVMPNTAFVVKCFTRDTPSVFIEHKFRRKPGNLGETLRDCYAQRQLVVQEFPGCSQSCTVPGNHERTVCSFVW